MSSRVRTVLGRLDRGVYALFARHADRPRHDRDRDRHRGAALSTDFETYLARSYGLSWLVAVAAGSLALLFGLVLVPTVPGTVTAFVSSVVPGEGATVPVSGRSLVFGAAMLVAASAKRIVMALSGAYLRWLAGARRAAIERSLPGAVRYLRTLANGSEGRRTMLRKVAERDAYDEAGTEFERVLETATVTGSLDAGLRTVARDTPSKALFAPFLLKFREHAGQGTESLREYLEMESRMLSHQQSRSRQRAGDHLELLAEVFVVLLFVPALFVVVTTVASRFVPALSGTVGVPGDPTVRAFVVYGNAAFVLGVGACAAVLVARLRPATHSRTYERPAGRGTLLTALSNPASAAFVFAFPAVVVGWGLWAVGEPFVNVLVLGYAAYGLPVGTVAVSRARLDDAKDREIRDFVHAVAGYVSLGQPFETAVESVAAEVEFGALGDDVDDLAFRLGLTTGSAGMDTRREALERFVARVGTPLSEQTVGLVTGALAVGSDAETTFETLQTEVGSLYHQRKELQSALSVYVAVGWAIALLAIGAVLAVELYVLEGIARVSTAIDIEPVTQSDAIGSGAGTRQLYVVTQATVLACGWFAGVAARGRYTALLHSSMLAVTCYLAFVGAGAI